MDATWLEFHGLDPALVLGKAGMLPSDMGTGLHATARTKDATGWTVEKSAEFVATAAAIGHITGPGLLLIPNIARVAVR